MTFDVKFTKSKGAPDCGAACMVSLLAYYGVEVTLEDMIKDCNVTTSGCTGKDMMVAGRKYGLDMRAWKELGAGEDAPEGAMTIDVAITKQDRPSIVWWKYNHFVVCCGTDENRRVKLMNPARGTYTVSADLFKSFYSDVSFTNGIPEWASGEGPTEEEE